MCQQVVHGACRPACHPLSGELSLFPNYFSSLRKNNAELRRQSTNSIYRGGALLHKNWRTRYEVRIDWALNVLIGTKRMFGGGAASQMAAASLASILPRLP